MAEPKAREQLVKDIVTKKDWYWEDVVKALNIKDTAMVDKIGSMMRRAYRGNWGTLKDDQKERVIVTKLISFLAELYK